jgi:hypothetical protein
MFTAQDEVGLACRKAVDIAKNAQFFSRTSKAATLTPRVTGGRAATAVDNPRSALDELQKLVDQQRAANPTLTEAGAWDKVYTDPKNATLVARERKENRPVASW